MQSMSFQAQINGVPQVPEENKDQNHFSCSICPKIFTKSKSDLAYATLATIFNLLRLICEQILPLKLIFSGLEQYRIGFSSVP